MNRVLSVGRGIRWYLRQVTGEAKWDEYLERARREGIQPVSRRDFERHRSEHGETNPRARCC
ncbi:MAG TPA: YbdD/YjiX family protein [Dermatophilaceae bacterium]|nr:YbdD/YjiX family protein [Dermatophilaceae bacterium]